jgi:hypothetical protein
MMEKSQYKILVLSDVTKSATSTLRSSASLAKMIDGNVEFFCVKKPTDIVEKENQLSAIRTINQKYNITGKEIEKIVKPISETYNLAIKYNHTFGNLKNEIRNYISIHEPDVIVLGKRKSKILGILGDNITDFILKIFDGIVMIVSEKNELTISDQLSIGILNESKQSKSKDFIESLISVSKTPPKVFKISEDSNLEKNSSYFSTKPIEYVFEKGANALQNIANYSAKSKTNLVLLDRNKNQNNYTLKEAINNFNCSLILTN